METADASAAKIADMAMCYSKKDSWTVTVGNMLLKVLLERQRDNKDIPGDNPSLKPHKNNRVIDHSYQVLEAPNYRLAPPLIDELNHRRIFSRRHLDIFCARVSLQPGIVDMHRNQRIVAANLAIGLLGVKIRDTDTR
jgi:hypothetical protein